MAATESDVIIPISVETSSGDASIKELAASVRNAKKDLDALKVSSDEYQSALIRVASATDLLKAAQQRQKEELLAVNNSTKEVKKTIEDSLPVVEILRGEQEALIVQEQKLVIAEQQLIDATIQLTVAEQSLSQQNTGIANSYKKIEPVINDHMAYLREMSSTAQEIISSMRLEEVVTKELREDLQSLNRELDNLNPSSTEYSNIINQIAARQAILINRSAELTAAIARETSAYTQSTKAAGRSINSIQTQAQYLITELPNIAQSPMIFVRAISNNFAQIGMAMQNTGARITDVFKQLGKGFIGPLGIISIITTAITLIINYSDEIGAWIQRVFGATKAEQELNAVRKDGISTVKDQITELQFLSQELNSSSISINERIAILKNLAEQTNFNVDVDTDWLNQEKAIIDNTSIFIAALERRAISQAALDKIAQLTIEKQERLNKLEEDGISFGQRILANLESQFTFSDVREEYAQRELNQRGRINEEYERQIANIKQLINFESLLDSAKIDQPKIVTTEDAKGDADNYALSFWEELEIDLLARRPMQIGPFPWSEWFSQSFGDDEVNKTVDNIYDALFGAMRMRDLRTYSIEFLDGMIEINKAIVDNENSTADQIIAARRRITDITEELKDREIAIQQSALDSAGSIFNSMSQIAGEQTAAGKAFAVATATIDTYATANKAYSSLASIPYVGPALGAAAAAAAIVAGIANVKKILSVKTPTVKGVSNSTTGISGSITAVPQPIATLTSPIVETHSNMTSNEVDTLTKPQKVYVLESDITEAQYRVQVVENETRF